MYQLVLKTSDQVSAAVQEFDITADSLGVSDRERCGSLGLNRRAYRSWQAGTVDVHAPIDPALVRRLGYALPLLRRMATNVSSVSPGRTREQLHSAGE